MRYLAALAMLAVLAVLAAAAPASAMPTSEFISRWQAASHLSRKPGQQLTAAEIADTPEIRLLFGEFSAVAHAYRQQIVDARAAGRQPRACPPKDVDLTIDGVIAEIGRLPGDWRSRDLTSSFGAAMDHRFPCAPPIR